MAAQLVGKSAADSLRHFCCDHVLVLKLGFLLSSLVLNAVGPLFSPAVCPLFYSLLIVHCPEPVHVSPLVRAATVRHVLRLVVRCPFELFSASPCISTSCSSVHVLTHVFFSWSVGCVSNLNLLRVVRWLCQQPAHSSPPRAARGVVAFFTRRRAAVLMALHESPAMALHGLSQFCFVAVAFLVTAHFHVAILLWSALAEGLSPSVGSPEYGCDRVSRARLLCSSRPRRRPARVRSLLSAWVRIRRSCGSCKILSCL